jgi:hypothetical protein
VIRPSEARIATGSTAAEAVIRLGSMTDGLGPNADLALRFLRRECL